jgi:hypothetical protein
MLFDQRIYLARCTEFLGVRPGIDDSVRQKSWKIAQYLVQGSFRMGTLFSACRESRVYDDACQPRGKRRPALKRAQADVSPAQAVLHGILYIFPVVQHSECSPIEPPGVAAEQMFLSIAIPSDGFLNDGPLLAPFERNDRSVNIRPPYRGCFNPPWLSSSRFCEEPGGTGHGLNIG